MCGVAGYIGTESISDERVRTCLSRMRRRGPDANGIFRHIAGDNSHVLLLHSRLAIIDLDHRSDQPLLKSGQALVFNGELYNYLEIRTALQREGRSFTTCSDSEVLLESLAARGLDGLDHCEGMWAFAWFDAASHTLLLGRDRFGEKPLYLYESPHGLFFGSEPKFIFALAGSVARPNVRQIQRFLVNGYKSLYKHSETFFDGISELPAGCALEANAAGTRRLKRYWRPDYTLRTDMTYAQAVDGARAALIRSVELRLRADVPLAFCMSGGVDSNALISIARRQFGYKVHGFTIANTDCRYEEMDLVHHAVAELGIDHTAIPLKRDGFLEKLRELVRYHDAPVYTITYFVHWLLMQSIRDHGYRISVSGTAADELFTGYYDHHSFYLAQTASYPDLYARSLRNWRTHIAPIVRNPLLQDPECFLRNPQARGHIFLDADRFAGYLNDPFYEAFHEEAYSGDLLRNRMLNELFHEATPVILHEDDLNAMYHSIENRSPFLDRALFEHCFAIPTPHLVRDGAAKAVLRDAMRGIVPDPILDNRRKVGFNAPILDLLDVHDPEVRKTLLDDSPIFELVRRDAIEALLRTDGKSESDSKFLFSFLSSKLFLEAFGA